MAITETTQEIDDRFAEHTDCEVCDENDLTAQLEAAVAVALQIRALEVRVQVLEEALTSIKGYVWSVARDSQVARHVYTVCNLALADRSHEGVGK